MDRVKINEAKRKLRALKKLEIKIRRVNAGLVWDDFFGQRYPAEAVAAMDKAAYKRIVEEYFYRVYYKLYAEGGARFGTYDPELLSRLGLPPDADASSVKARFRELAKLYHPDNHGDGAAFAQMMEDYEALINPSSRA